MGFLVALEVGGGTSVDLNLLLGVAGPLLTAVVVAAVARALHGEQLRRHDKRIEKIEDAHVGAPPAVVLERVKKLEALAEEHDDRIRDVETNQAVQADRDGRASASTTTGSRRATKK